MTEHTCPHPPNIPSGAVMPRPDWECGDCGRLWRFVAHPDGGGVWIEVRGPALRRSKWDGLKQRVATSVRERTARDEDGERTGDMEADVDWEALRDGVLALIAWVERHGQ